MSFRRNSVTVGQGGKLSMYVSTWSRKSSVWKQVTLSQVEKPGENKTLLLYKESLFDTKLVYKFIMPE